ncbi:MAG: hypothetical protein ACRD3M_14150 [Thermoanaerobaculia bacterium]
MRRASILLLTFVLGGCVPDYIENAQKWFVPLDQTVRAKRSVSQVAFLEKEPTDRKFKVIGIVAPAESEYDSYAEAINAARLSAALHGADAIFLISDEEGEKWGFKVSRDAIGGSAGGGSGKTFKIRAKAIVWTE